MAVVRGRCARGLQWKMFPKKSAAQNSDASPLLLIHGYACGMADWGALPRMLSSRGRDVAVYSHRGLDGSAIHSTKNGAPATVGDLAGDAASCLESLGWKDRSVHVMGISLGGMVAQQLALDAPELVRSLVLGCTTHGGRDATPPPLWFLELCSSWAESDFGDDVAQRDFATKFVDSCGPPDFAKRPGAERLRGKMIDTLLATERSSDGLQQQFQALGRYNSTKRLGELGAFPTLVVHGSADECVPFANGESLARRIPNATLREWVGSTAHGAGHFFWLERPQDLTDVLSDFMSEHDAARV